MNTLPPGPFGCIPYLSACCRHCDASISAPCPLEQIRAVNAEFAAAGWGYDENLYVICPDCAAGRRPEPMAVEPSRQGALGL